MADDPAGGEGRDVIKAQSLRAEAAGQDTERMDADIEQLSEQEVAARRFLEERGVSPAHPAPSDAASAPTAPAEVPPTWDELVAYNRSWLDEAGLENLSLDALLTPRQLDELESIDPLGRERWSASDYVTVGVCGVIGLLATAFDDQIDSAVKIGLGGLKQLDFMREFERDGRGLAIDHTGRKFGGPDHRVRSSGHDIGRPWEALRQIRKGEFRGVYWEHGQRLTRVVDGYQPHDPAEAMVLWLKHLSADLVTTTSLPLPWWTHLYELPNKQVRTLAHELYLPRNHTGPGINVRSMLISKKLPVITSEVAVGAKVHLDAYSRTESLRLSANEGLKKSEMLLAAHATTGLTSVGKVVLTAGGLDFLALRHLNPPALARAGYLGQKVVREHRRRARDRAVPSWDELLVAAPVPWELDELKCLRAPARYATAFWTPETE